MPNVLCLSCRLTSYVVAPHAARPQCPHCDADLLPAVPRGGSAAASPPEAGDEATPGLSADAA